MSEKWRNLHHWQKFNTTAGSDGRYKYHLCLFVWVAPYLIIRSITSKDVDAMDTMDQTKEEGQADMGG